MITLVISRIVQYSNVTCRKHIWIPYYKKLSFTEKLKSLLALASLQSRCPWLALCRILFVRQADLHRDKPLEFFTENQHVTAEWQISLINLLKWEVVIDCERLRLVAIMYMIYHDINWCQAPWSYPGNHDDHQCCSSEVASMGPHLSLARETRSLSYMKDGEKRQ
jgi:hypothetical protein